MVIPKRLQDRTLCVDWQRFCVIGAGIGPWAADARAAGWFRRLPSCGPARHEALAYSICTEGEPEPLLHAISH
jgi:hypothetical protein